MWEKIKVFKVVRKGTALLGDDAAFTALLIVVVAAAAFSLGRWSVVALVTPESASIVFSEAAATVAGADTTMRNATETVAVAPATTGKFVGSKNSDKYHLPWCSGAARIKEENKVWFADAAEAERFGYTPASNCPGL